MYDILYNIRKAINRFKRRFLRPTAEDLSEKIQYEPKFKRTIIIGGAALGCVVVVVLLAVFGVIPVGFLNKTPIEADATPTQSLSVTPSAKPTSTLAPTPSPSPTPEPTPAITPIIPDGAQAPLPLLPSDNVIETGYINIDFLNVRSGSSTSHSVLGILPKFSIVEVVGKEEWLRIKFLDGVGYISTKYYVAGSIPTPTPGPSPTPEGYDGPEIRRQVNEDMAYEGDGIQITIDKVNEDEHQFFAIEIQCDPEDIHTLLADEEMDPKTRRTPSDMAAEVEAVLAVNGDYVSYRDKGVVIRNGKLYRDDPEQELMVLYKDGRLVGIYPDDADGEQLVADGALHCWSFGPILVEEHTAFDDFTGRSNVKPANPRTGIGMFEPGRYLIIVADGRQPNITGFTMVEFAKLFEDYGVKTAYNLDGGEATTLVFKGEIINKPCGPTEKASGDIIYIK